MANPVQHAALGAFVALLPDVALLAFGWRKRWLPDTDPAVRAHRFLHSRYAVPLVVALAYASHLWLDSRSTHRGARWA